jgi:hypothetical protein
MKAIRLLRWRPQFRLRTLLLLLAAVCAALGGFAFHIMQLRTELGAIERLSKSGCQIGYVPREPQWLWQLTGDEYRKRAAVLHFDEATITEAIWNDILLLPQLQGLYIENSVVNCRLARLQELSELVALSLRRSRISGAIDVHDLGQLQDVDVAFTDVDRLVVDGCRALESVTLRASKIDDDAVEELSDLPALKTLDIAGAPAQPNNSVTDASLESLEGVSSLRTLYLYGAAVSTQGCERLRAANPALKIVD